MFFENSIQEMDDIDAIDDNDDIGDIDVMFVFCVYQAVIAANNKVERFFICRLSPILKSNSNNNNSSNNKNVYNNNVWRG